MDLPQSSQEIGDLQPIGEGLLRLVDVGNDERRRLAVHHHLHRLVPHANSRTDQQNPVDRKHPLTCHLPTKSQAQTPPSFSRKRSVAIGQWHFFRKSRANFINTESSLRIELHLQVRSCFPNHQRHPALLHLPQQRLVVRYEANMWKLGQTDDLLVMRTMQSGGKSGQNGGDSRSRELSQQPLANDGLESEQTDRSLGERNLSHTIQLRQISQYVLQLHIPLVSILCKGQLVNFDERILQHEDGPGRPDNMGQHLTNRQYLLQFVNHLPHARTLPQRLVVLLELLSPISSYHIGLKETPLVLCLSRREYFEKGGILVVEVDGSFIEVVSDIVDGVTVGRELIIDQQQISTRPNQYIIGQYIVVTQFEPKLFQLNRQLIDKIELLLTNPPLQHPHQLLLLLLALILIQLLPADQYPPVQAVLADGRVVRFQLMELPNREGHLPQDVRLQHLLNLQPHRRDILLNPERLTGEQNTRTQPSRRDAVINLTLGFPRQEVVCHTPKLTFARSAELSEDDWRHPLTGNLEDLVADTHHPLETDLLPRQVLPMRQTLLGELTNIDVFLLHVVGYKINKPICVIMHIYTAGQVWGWKEGDSWGSFVLVEVEQHSALLLDLLRQAVRQSTLLLQPLLPPLSLPPHLLEHRPLPLLLLRPRRLLLLHQHDSLETLPLSTHELPLVYAEIGLQSLLPLRPAGLQLPHPLLQLHAL